MATPPSLPEDFTPDVAAARAIVEGAVARRAAPGSIRSRSTRLLAAYSIPVTPVVARARSPMKPRRPRRPLLAGGGTVAVKILSPDIVHKSDVGGVRLNLTSEQAVREATADILARAQAAKPDARITGVTIHPMIVRPKARELIAGIADDPTFGPVVVFGSGGTAVEVINDKALALPPLDLKLAHDLIARTRIVAPAQGLPRRPGGGRGGVALVLVKLAQLAADLPEIREVDLNPLLADETGVIAVDARVAIAPVDSAQTRRASGIRALRSGPIRRNGSGTSRCGRHARSSCGRSGRRTRRLYPPLLLRASPQEDLRLRFFAPVRNSATPSSRGSPRSTTRAPWRSLRSTKSPARCSAWRACTPMRPTTPANMPSWSAPT